MYGTVFDIQRFCVDDGPGIRTAVFLKGCPMRCLWCHNAEGLSRKIQLFYNSESCINCMACAKICPTKAHSFNGDDHELDFNKCVACGKCADVCPSDALRIVGKNMSVDEVIGEVLKDSSFYNNSGGGLTLSGGEPLMQHEFATSIAKNAKEKGIHVAIETSCNCDKSVIRDIMPYVDLFLVDFKHYDEQRHFECTGAKLSKIIENLEYISSSGKKIVLRCPIIPNINDCKEHYVAIAKLADRLDGVSEVNIEPYHPLGVSKYESIGIEAKYTLTDHMDKKKANEALEIISAHCSKKVYLN